MSDFNRKFYIEQLKVDLAWTLKCRRGEEPCSICGKPREQCIREKIKDAEERLNESNISD